MHTGNLRFTEIEHKFVVDERLDLRRFEEALAPLGPVARHHVRVRDRYYLTNGGAAGRFLLRHRYDAELHHLTIKTLARDTEVRTEVNLDLGHHLGDQAAAVDAFIAHLGVRWQGTIEKDLDVWDFPDCEVVHYVATTDQRTLRCVEFEAIRQTSVPDALAVLARYERATGFSSDARSHLSLPQLLFPDLADHLERAT